MALPQKFDSFRYFVREKRYEEDKGEGIMIKLMAF